ncbi:hypothetical protein [Paraburkholderia heleia]|uniref:hypothetical protein n=1 Tax=Paraburkholderia heleia TaxID=634127 RepID=UPI0031CF18FE
MAKRLHHRLVLRNTLCDGAHTGTPIAATIVPDDSTPGAAMRVGKLTLAARCIALCAGFAAGISATHGAGTFDGDWNVTLTCPKGATGTSGYRYQFPAEIQQNILHGEHGERDAGGWLMLDGKLEPDGSATLVAQGLSDASPHANTRSTYSYEVSAQFDASSGSGSRTTARKCDFVFVKE